MDPQRAEKAASGTEHRLDAIIDDGLLRSVFQPVADLETGVLFGFEALTRGPKGPLGLPSALFAAARMEGRVAELDQACQRTAVAAARAQAIEAPLTLFVNAEPDGAGFGPLPPIGPGVRGVVELTERTLTSRLAELLPAVHRARAEGWGIALDDVGADTRSLALMPLLRPDVIKLDLRLVQEQPTPDIAAIAGAVGAQAESTGATVLAEGIETVEQAQYARALGATLGQGFLFGRPTARPKRKNVAGIPVPIFTVAMPHPWRTPFDLASSRRPVRRGTMPLLAAISDELERQAARRSPTSLLISSFPGEHDPAARIETTYTKLATELAFVGTMTVDLPPSIAPRLRGVNIRDDDPLRGTWNVVVISPDFAAMLAARADREDGSYEFVLTHHRDLIIECAQALMLRIAMSGDTRISPDAAVCNATAPTRRARQVGALSRRR